MTKVVPLNGVSRDEGGDFRTAESRTHGQGETGSSAHGAEEASEDGSKTQTARGRVAAGNDTKMFEEKEEVRGTSEKMGVT